MTSLLPRSRVFPNIIDWIENPWPFGEHNLVRIEESVDEGAYVVRAELPGFDPEKQVHVTAQHGLLTIAAEREARTKENGRSEFRYGSFSRTVSLPAGADTEKITAKYTDGILEVTVPIQERKTEKPVEVAVDKG
ncbi:Hsp20/alpha crystallin family protein [Amycolatopsis thermoflava]|uniref:Hsp20/alpha crystallin family protein n=1 Tax=Amycolatopsis thermoflava TaxID=84480 RepID=UPI00364E3E62